MRFLIAGVALVLLAVGLAEYDRRHPHAKDGAATPTTPGKPTLPASVQALLETTPPGADSPAPVDPYTALLTPPVQANALNGFAPVVSGDFAARELRGGFGAVLFVVDLNGGSAIVRAVAGEGYKVIAARTARITTLQVDGSTAFFAEGGKVLSLGARGDDAPKVRVSFSKAVVTALAAVGDTVYVALQPATGDDQGLVARVDSDGSVTLIAADQDHAHGLVADGKDVFWVAGRSPAMWRASADASFSSKVAEGAEAPLALDGDGVVLRQDGELHHVGRAGGRATVLATAEAEAVCASSGLVRYTTREGLFEVTAGNEPTQLLKTPGVPLGVALGGTSLYVLFKTDRGAALYAK
jgi:hypothetical protein